MRIDGPALLVRIYIGEADHHEGKPLYQAIVELLRERGLAGATVLRGIEGYGANAHLHTTRLLRLSEDLPLLIEVVDQEDRIRAILPELDELVGDGLITLEKVEVIAYRGRGPSATAATTGATGLRADAGGGDRCERAVNDRPTPGYRELPRIRRWPRPVPAAPRLGLPGSSWRQTVPGWPSRTWHPRPPACGRSRIRPSSGRCWPKIGHASRSCPNRRRVRRSSVPSARNDVVARGCAAIHLSASSNVPARLAALRDGFDEALPQTVDALELAARAAWLEEGARSRPAGRLPIANGFELDLVAHELRFEGRAVHLRPKEFLLLAMLAAHPGRAYSRRQLLDRVWGVDQVGDPRTVDVHVRWLRSKIEQQPDRPVHLVTVRGVGYRLDPPLTEP